MKLNKEEQMKTIIVAKPGSISQEQREYLSQNDIVIIEIENQSDIKVLNGIELIKQDELLQTFIKTIDEATTADSTIRSKLYNNLVKLFRK